MKSSPPHIIFEPASQPAGRPPRYSQCDCGACPELRFPAPASSAAPAGALRCADVHQQALSPDYTLMFPPAGRGGVAVLNAPARDLWASFRSPRPLSPCRRRKGKPPRRW